MPRVTRGVNHLSAAEIDQRITQATHQWHRLAWQIILTAREDPRPAAVIARQCSVSQDVVHNVIARYHREGPTAITPPHPWNPGISTFLRMRNGWGVPWPNAPSRGCANAMGGVR